MPIGSLKDSLTIAESHPILHAPITKKGALAPIQKQPSNGPGITDINAQFFSSPEANKQVNLKKQGTLKKNRVQLASLNQN